MVTNDDSSKPMNAISRDCHRRQELFLACYEKHGIVSLAAAEAGIPIGTVEYWDSADTQGFKKRKLDAGLAALGVLEAEIHRRGVQGVEKPIIYRGEITGQTREYSDNLLMFRAKRLDPAYKDNYQAPALAPNSVTQINIHLHPSVGANAELGAVEAPESVTRLT